MKYVIASSKVWDKKLVKKVQRRTRHKFTFITKKSELTYERLKKINPDKVFFPHWSYILGPEIYENFNCVMFHMTDLPFGRGGSPLQNLIVRGHKKTKISAFLCDGGIDTGPIFSKKPLGLSGTAQEIFVCATQIIEDMIVDIVKRNPKPKKQTGPATSFKRRTPNDSDLSTLTNLKAIFDHIRMLDAKDYPHAFLKFGKIKVEFTEAKLAKKNIFAKVRFYEEK